MKLKTIATLAVAGLLASSLTACAAVEPDGSSAQASTTQEVPVKAKKVKKKPSMTRGQENALESAENYLEGQSFSKKGLRHQLKFEDYSTADAKFAVDHVKANWKAEAVESAEGYLDGQSFSKSGLLHQLKFEKFTDAQAQYAVDKVYR